MTVHVLHVIDHLGYGGAPLVVRNMVERLDRSRIEPMVCALRSNAESIPIDAEVITLNNPRYGLAAIGQIKRLCHQRQIGVLHAHLQKSIICSLLATLSVPVLIHEHGGILRSDTTGRVYRILLRLLRRRIRTAIGISQATAQRLREVTDLPAERIVTIPNFVDVRRFDPSLYEAAKARRRWAEKNDTIVLGFVGRLDHCKGADLLVEAMALLVGKGLSCSAVIVGQGRQYESLRRQIQDLHLEKVVTLAGLATNPAEYMAGFDIGVVPSRREGFGVVAAEYLSMGVPVVAARTGGLPEVVTDGETGVLVSANDARDLADALAVLIQNPAQLTSLWNRVKHLRHHFDGSQQVEQLQQLYERSSQSS